MGQTFVFVGLDVLGDAGHVDPTAIGVLNRIVAAITEPAVLLTYPTRTYPPDVATWFQDVFRDPKHATETLAAAGYMGAVDFAFCASAQPHLERWAAGEFRRSKSEFFPPVARAPVLVLDRGPEGDPPANATRSQQLHHYRVTIDRLLEEKHVAQAVARRWGAQPCGECCGGRMMPRSGRRRCDWCLESRCDPHFDPTF